MAGGHPTDYSEEKHQIAKDYLQRCIDNGEIPFVEQLAFFLDVARSTVYEWVDTHTEFSDTIKKIKDLNLFMLQKNSLLGVYNPASAIFQMKANHGMMETVKQVQEHHFKDLDDEQLDKLIRQKSAEAGVGESAGGKEKTAGTSTTEVR